MKAYERPGWFARNVFNGLVGALVRIGIGPWGSRLLEVPGRSSGVPRRVPVNVIAHEGTRYLVAPRGETQWARNLRAAGGGVLVLGRRRERFTAVELPDAEKVAVLRAYLGRWQWQVGAFFDGVTADAPDSELARIAPRHPVFLIEPAAP